MATSEHTERHSIQRNEVPAGPGDAGRADRAETLPGAERTRPKGRQATVLFVALMIVGLIVLALLTGAA